MAVKIPQIPPIEDPAELINLVSGSKLYKERMTELLAIYDKLRAELFQYQESLDVQALRAEKLSIQADLDRYQKIKDLDVRMAEAKQAVTDAKEAKVSAEKALAQAQQDIRAGMAELTAKREAAEKWQQGVRDGQDARTKSLDDRELRVAHREGEVAKAASGAKLAQETASKLAKINSELKEELESKLGKLRAITI